MKRLNLKSTIKVGDQNYLVSTIDLFGGDDIMSIINNKGYFFETMIFKVLDNGSIDLNELFCKRYLFAKEAEEGHKNTLNNFNLIIKEVLK